MILSHKQRILSSATLDNKSTGPPVKGLAFTVVVCCAAFVCALFCTAVLLSLGAHFCNKDAIKFQFGVCGFSFLECCGSSFSCCALPRTAFSNSSNTRAVLNKRIVSTLTIVFCRTESITAVKLRIAARPSGNAPVLVSAPTTLAATFAKHFNNIRFDFVSEW